MGRGKGPGVGLGLLVMCFVLALNPVGEQAQSAGGEAEVEVPVVALTFDDGPRWDTTSWLMEQLALREVPATFFMVGSRIPGNEDLIRQMKEQGCQIGVHTYDHVDVTGLSQTDFDLQIGKTRTLLREILGEGNYWLRPPYGFVDQGVRTWSDGPIILWSVDPEDWKDHDVERIVASVVERVEDGDVILMHDIYQSSVEAAHPHRGRSEGEGVLLCHGGAADGPPGDCTGGGGDFPGAAIKNPRPDGRGRKCGVTRPWYWSRGGWSRRQ